MTNIRELELLKPNGQKLGTASAALLTCHVLPLLKVADVSALCAEYKFGRHLLASYGVF